MLPSYFKYAQKASVNSDYKIKLGACILVKGMPISVGWNMRYKTHPLTRKYHETQTLHSEVMCIVRVKNKELLKGSTMVVYREDKVFHQPNLSRPCKTCVRIMYLFGIEKVIYTIPGGYMEENVKDMLPKEST